MGAEQLSDILDGFINKKAKNLGEIRIESHDPAPDHE
jgi:hypothetical protein